MPWQSVERAFLFDPGQLGPMLAGFLQPGRLIWLVPESVAVRAQMRAAGDVGNLYDDMLAHCLPVGAVADDARPRSVEEAISGGSTGASGARSRRAAPDVLEQRREELGRPLGHPQDDDLVSPSRKAWSTSTEAHGLT